MCRQIEVEVMDYADMLNQSDWIRDYNEGKTRLHTKNPIEVNREYDLEKWNQVIQILKKERNLTDLFKLEERLYGKEIFEGYTESDGFVIRDSSWFTRKQIELYLSVLNSYIYEGCKILELGAGYGHIIFRLMKYVDMKDLSFAAGEYAFNGIRSMRLLAERMGLVIDLGKCDFFSCYADEKLKKCNNGILFTSYALMYVPELRDDFINYLLSFDVEYGIHFEPCYEYYDKNTEHGRMCRKYTEINDYNRNLVSVIKQAETEGYIKILECKLNVFGENFLCPISVIVWKRMREGKT